MSDLRIVERREETEWVRVRMSQLEPGDIFRMFEATGEPIEGWWTACSEPTEKNGVVHIIGDPIEE